MTLERDGDSSMQNMQLHLINLSIYLCVHEDAVSCPVSMLGEATCLHGPLAFCPKRDLWIWPFCCLINAVCFNCRFWLKTERNEILFVTLNSEQSHNHIFGFCPFPPALPPCRHQHSFPKRVQFCTMKCLHACTYKYRAHTTPISKLHEAITTFTVWQENKSACTWISAHQSKALWLL